MEIELRNVSKKFLRPNGTYLNIFENFNMTIDEGTVNCILGSSGCGKTTFLNMIAGFEKQDKGEIIFANRKEDYRIGILFQDNVLFPWKTVMENILFACKGKFENPQKIIKEYLKKSGLENIENCYPSEISGGMQQRIALIRILLTNPKLVILDEAFGNLDFVTRSQMQDMFLELHKERRFTAIIVTHDIMEAVKLGDNIYFFQNTPVKYESLNNKGKKNSISDTNFFKSIQLIYNSMDKGDINFER